MFALEKLASQTPTLDYLWLHLANAYLSLGSTAKAKALLIKTSQINPKNAYAIYLLGKVERSIGNNKAAMELFRSIQDDAFISHRALFEMGDILKGDRAAEEAKTLWRKSLRLKPFYTPSWLSLVKGGK